MPCRLPSPPPVQSVPPRLYATNVRALSFGECRRLMGGWVPGGLGWVMTRWARPQGRQRLPLPYHELECAATELGLNLTAPLSQLARPLLSTGFRALGYQRMRSSEDPAFLDGGGCVLLGEDRSTIALIHLVLHQDPAAAGGLRRVETIAFLGFLAHPSEEGYSTLCVHNFAAYLDPRRDQRQVFVTAADVATLQARFHQELEGLRRPARKWGGWPEVRAALEADDLATFLQRRDRRRLFVPCPEASP